MAAIPVIDYFALVRCGDGSLEGKMALRELHRALSTIGFVYVVNHEIEEHLASVHSAWTVDNYKLYILAIASHKDFSDRCKRKKRFGNNEKRGNGRSLKN